MHPLRLCQELRNVQVKEDRLRIPTYGAPYLNLQGIDFLFLNYTKDSMVMWFSIQLLVVFGRLELKMYPKRMA